MNCYLCGSTSFFVRKGDVRDAPSLQIFECSNCGLVSLSSLDHIQPGFYENSGMHGGVHTPIETWLKDTEWDDQRRFEMLKAELPNKKLLDFGCGAGGFVSKAKQLADSVAGIELEVRVREYWAGRISVYPTIESAGQGYDLITAFHVVEHLPDPRALLSSLATKLARSGRIVVEVPNSEDVLLTLYDSDAFQSFAYWSQHLFLFSGETLQRLAEQAGLRIVAIQQYQRYSLSNHLYWLCKGLPGGHAKWAFMDNADLRMAYSNALASIGKCDTLIAYLELAD